MGHRRCRRRRTHNRRAPRARTRAKPSWGAILLVAAAVALDFGAVALVFHPSLLRAPRRLRRATVLRPDQRGAHDQRELRQRVLAVLDLVAGRRRGHEQRTVAGEARAELLEEPRAIVGMERRRAAR